MKNICAKCNGTGQIGAGSAFVDAGECPPETKKCMECNGEGFIKPRFFVEFVFASKESRRIYWLPLFILADNFEEANNILKPTVISIKEKFENVSHSKPIAEIDFTKLIIETKYNIYRHQKVAFLNLKVWQFEDIIPDPDLSFDEHLEFIMNELPLYPRDIAHEVESYRFPVRVIRKGSDLFDFEELLLINVVM